MAHIPEGVLSAPVLLGGAAVSVGLLTFALRRLDYDRLPQAATLSAAFFVSSLISIPLGPGSVHLLLVGLMGLLLGWAALPALVVALTLQAVFFGAGGVLVLGVNTMNLALPALVCAAGLRPLLGRVSPGWIFWVGLAAGALGVALTAAMVGCSLALSGEQFLAAARVLVAAYLPLAVIEGLITGTVVAFLHRVEPRLLLDAEASGA
jgi:cobalt/nickel transport system permease protein